MSAERILGLRFRFEAAASAPRDAGGCDDGGEPVRGEWLRLAAAPADRITSDARDRPGDPLMVAGGIGYAGVAVRCRDGSAGYQDGGAVVGAVRQVGGGIRRQGGVAVLGAPGPTQPPRRAVLRAGVRAARLRYVALDSRLVSGGDRNCGRATGAGELVFSGSSLAVAKLVSGVPYHHL